MFENDGPRAVGAETISTMAIRAIEAGINERPGVRYQELTDPSNPRPVFAVLFVDAGHKAFFDSLFEPALKLCGLRVNTLRGLNDSPVTVTVTDSPPAEARKTEFGHIDRGDALLVPSERGPIEET